MTTLIECIPNVSEGRRPEVVAAIRGAALAAGPGVLLLDGTSDADHNRSVLTFLGDGPSLLRAMEALAECAGTPLATLPLDAQDALWNQAKRDEPAAGG